MRRKKQCNPKETKWLALFFVLDFVAVSVLPLILNGV